MKKEKQADGSIKYWKDGVENPWTVPADLVEKIGESELDKKFSYTPIDWDEITWGKIMKRGIDLIRRR